ncbi:hypothetical protein HZB00_00590 [Candidatus Woesearchaeota archaeon]|nr:hypothetical protein [Candidatus Woesearchaeota archaeon]
MYGYRIITLLLISLLFIPSLSALDYSVSTQTSQLNPLCPRETGVFVDIVRNTGTAEQAFAVASTGSAAAWSTIVPSVFSLSPGESREISTYITPRSSASAGNYLLDLLFNSNQSTSLQHAVRVKDCFASRLSSLETEKQVCPGQVLSYEATLFNAGEYSEDFLLQTEGDIQPMISLSDDIVHLEKGQSKKVYIYITSPKDSGDYAFSFITTGSSGKTTATLPFVLHIAHCYDYITYARNGNAFNLCDGDFLRVPIAVENKGTVTNLYRLQLNAPAWIQLEKDRLTLLPSVKDTASLLAHPPYGTQGEFSAPLLVTPERGILKATVPFVFTVRKCRNVQLTLPQTQDTLCSDSTPRTYNAFIKNTGDVAETYALTMQSPSWVQSTDPLFVSLQPGQESPFHFRADPELNIVPGIYAVNLSVNATDASRASASGKQTFLLRVVDAVSCSKPVLESKENSIQISSDASKTIVFTAKNIGVESGDYIFSLQGNATSFSRITPNSISLLPEKNTSVYIYLAPGPQTSAGTYTLSAHMQLRNSTILSEKTFFVTVHDVRAPRGFVTNSTSGLSRFNGWISRLFTPLPENRTFATPKSQNATQTSSFNSLRSVLLPLESLANTLYPFRYYILGTFVVLLLFLLFVRLGLQELFISSPEERKEEIIETPKEKPKRIISKPPKRKEPAPTTPPLEEENILHSENIAQETEKSPEEKKE